MGNSDGKTPQDKVNQILAIAPILPGQETQMPAAPTQQARPPDVNTQQAQQPPQQLQHQQQQQPGGTNLIDFGDNVMTPKASTSQGGAPQTLSMAQNSNSADLMDLQQPQIVRRDTDTKSVDEFVDAEG